MTVYTFGVQHPLWAVVIYLPRHRKQAGIEWLNGK